MSGFRQVKSTAGETALMDEREIAVSTTINSGDLCIYNGDGKLTPASAGTDKPVAVANETKTSTATGGETIQVVDAMRGNRGVFQTDLTPLYDDLTASAGSTTQATIAASGVSSDDLAGGTIYCKELDEQRIISGNSATSGGNINIDVIKPFSATLNAKTIRVVPYGQGDAAVKLDASTPDTDVSNAIADVSGGNVKIEKVDLANKLVQVSFNA